MLSTSSEPFSGQGQLDAISRGKNRLYAKGAIYYMDVFGKSHRTRFCFKSGQGDLTNLRMAACLEHNDMAAIALLFGVCVLVEDLCQLLRSGMHRRSGP